jgi:hypothetical protein
MVSAFLASNAVNFDALLACAGAELDVFLVCDANRPPPGYSVNKHFAHLEFPP